MRHRWARHGVRGLHSPLQHEGVEGRPADDCGEEEEGLPLGIGHLQQTLRMLRHAKAKAWNSYMLEKSRTHSGASDHQLLSDIEFLRTLGVAESLPWGPRR